MLTFLVIWRTPRLLFLWVHLVLLHWLTSHMDTLLFKLDSYFYHKQGTEKKLYIILYCIIFFSMFETSPFSSIWLEISINWHTKSQRPKKKCIHFSRGRINPCLARTACNYGSFTSYMAFLFNPFFPQLYVFYFKTF